MGGPARTFEGAEWGERTGLSDNDNVGITVMLLACETKSSHVWSQMPLYSRRVTVQARRTFLFLSVSVIAGTLAVATHLHNATPATAQTPPVYTGIVKGVAVGGYDPVAYFTENKPVKGNPAIALEHGGAQYHFSSEANRELFKKDPAKYAPQYGGYCAWAVAEGYTAHGDPNHWTISDGKLFLNYNRSVKTTWEKDIPGNLKRSEINWPKLIAEKKK